MSSLPLSEWRGMHITSAPSASPRRPSAPAPNERARGDGLDGFEDPKDAVVIGTSTVLGAAAGAALLGLATAAATGATETLLGLVQGGVAGAGLGIVGGAVLSTAMLAKPGTQGRIGLAIVGGALGGVAGLATGAFAGAYLGHAFGNAIGYAGGAVAGGATGYFASRHFLG